MDAKVIVTGASGSVGAAAAEALVRQGRCVVMACRNAQKAESVRADILSRVPAARLEIRPLELSLMASVRAFAEGFGPGEVGALFNNAGVISRGYALTPEGLEHTFAVNYFGPFLLTERLLPAFTEDARIVNMVSLTCRFVSLSPESLHPSEKDFSRLGTYARAKLALLYSSLALARRHPALKVNVADPGIVNSNMITMGKWFDPLADRLFRPFCRKPEEGVKPALAALAAEDGGRYYVGRKSDPVPSRWQDDNLQERLWTETEKMLSL